MFRWLHGWTESAVAPGTPAALTRRTYLEQEDLRQYVRTAEAAAPLRSACDVGCGFGRHTAVLREFAEHVVGYEREPALARRAARLNPALTFERVDTLARLPARDNVFDFALTFTVLQHLSDADAAAAARQITRVVRPGGHILLCEETDPSMTTPRARRRGSRQVVGRSMGDYAALLGSLPLIDSGRRRVEPTYPRSDVGTYMLFRLP